jgi:hypothetical protein
MICVHLVSKFSETEKGVTEYFAQSSVKEVWTKDKMKAEIYTDEKTASNIASKYGAHISNIPVI